MTRDQLAVYLEEYHEHMQLRAMLGTRVAGLEAVPRSVVLSKDEGNGSGCDQMSSGVYSKSIDTNCDDCDNISNQASNSNGTTSTHTNMNHNSNTKSYSAPPASLLCKDASLVRVRLEASSPSPPSTRGARQAYVRTCMQRGGAENAKAFVRPVRAEEEDLTAYVHARHVVVVRSFSLAHVCSLLYPFITLDCCEWVCCV